MTFKPVENPVFTLDLQRPIQYLGVPIKTVAIRAPTAGDIFRVGNPVRYDMRDNSIEFDDGKAFTMLSRLSGIPVDGSLEHMTTNDAVSCFWGFAGFFIPGLSMKPREQPASSPNTTDAPL